MEKETLNIKYSFQCQPRDLFLAISEPAYLKNWMAERVKYDASRQEYTFYWSDFDETAKVIEKVPEKLLRLEWQGNDRESGETLSFRIESDPKDRFVDLCIEDSCDPADLPSLKAEWESQLKKLREVLQ